MRGLYAYCVRVWEFSRCDSGPGPVWGYFAAAVLLLVALAVVSWRAHK